METSNVFCCFFFTGTFHFRILQALLERSFGMFSEHSKTSSDISVQNFSYIQLKRFRKKKTYKQCIKQHVCANVLITLLSLLEECLFITLWEPCQNVSQSSRKAETYQDYLWNLQQNFRFEMFQITVTLNLIQTHS